MNKLRSLILLIFLFASICADSSLAQFAHPGISHSQQSLDFIKSKIASGEQPWTTAWSVLKESRHASLEWRPQPFQHVERGPYNRPDVGSSEFSDDARAAYVHAVCWALSENKAHAEKAAEILNAWSSTLESVSNHDARLLVGMEGYQYCNAAELLRHTWDGWPQQEQERFEQMLRQVFYPTIKDFYPSANGNWDASMLQTMLAMGVFLEDQEMFERGVEYFLNGNGNGAIRNYFKPSGQCQESGRDQGHTQMGLNFLASTCEIAWNQGRDLYGAYENRLLKGFEYTAKYNLGMEVAYEPFRSFEGRYNYKSISDKSRGRFQSMYEKVLNHYENRKGIDAAFTRQVVMKLREPPEDRSVEEPQADASQAVARASQRSGGEDRRARERKTKKRWSSALDTLMFCGQAALASSPKVD